MLIHVKTMAKSTQNSMIKQPTTKSFIKHLSKESRNKGLFVVHTLI